MTHNPNIPPDPDDKKPEIDDDEGGSLRPFGAEDASSDTPGDSEGSVPDLENNGISQFDVPGTLFVDPPDFDQS